MMIACIGDSLTEGDYGVKGKTGIANVQKESYPYYLQKLMNCEVRNFGKCGYRSTTFLKYYDEGNVDVKNADIVLVMLGSNGGQSSTENTAENTAYETLLDRIRRDAPDAKVFLMTPPNATTNPEYSNCGYLPQVVEAQLFTRQIAEKRNLPVIDLAKSRSLSPMWEAVMQPNDGLHFGKMGYACIAQQVYDRIAPLRKPPFNTLKLNRHIPLVAHRGLSGIECENTGVAFTAAGNRSYYGIETDIWRTKDGKFICGHDPRTGRVCKEDHVIEKTDFNTLRALSLNDIDRETPISALRMPTVEEYVRICKKYHKHCVAEFKSEFTQEEIEKIVRVFEEADYLENTTFIGVSMNNLRSVRKILPEQSCQYLCGTWNLAPDWTERIGELLKTEKMDLDTDYFVLNKESIEHFHNLGIKVNAWTVDNPEIAEYLVDCGVDYITTNILEEA